MEVTDPTPAALRPGSQHGRHEHGRPEHRKDQEDRNGQGFSATFYVFSTLTTHKGPRVDPHSVHLVGLVPGKP